MMHHPVTRYYDLVDKGLIEELLTLFSSDVMYVRAGKVIDGKEALARFYRFDRKLAGTHTITSKQDLGGYSVVEGVFDGVNSQGQKISVPFADIFETEENLIVRRRTYLSLMNQVIE